MEIGSEFEWREDYLEKPRNGFILPYMDNGIFTFSGRTSIEQALKVISKKGKALLPSYCCDSMIEPFRNAGVKVYFYNVVYDSDSLKIIVDEEQLSNIDILLLMNYFGFKLDVREDIIQKFKKNNGIVIEDITHSLLSEHQYHDFSDYIIASLRKWGALLDGGYCTAAKYKLSKCETETTANFVQKKAKAMLEKSRYLHGENVDKCIFLELFNEANHIFAISYSNTAISNLSYDIFQKLPISDIKRKRINNARILYKELSKIEEIRFIFDMKDMECPLFVPILVNKMHRDMLRSYLIKHSIYCPIHWPKPKEILNSKFYEEEISLICDQRYDKSDMMRIANTIKEYFGY